MMSGFTHFSASLLLFFKIQNHWNWCGCVFGSLYVVVVFSFSSIVTMTKHFFKRLFFREINCLFTFFNCHQQHPLLLRCLLRHRTSRESNCHAKVAWSVWSPCNCPHLECPARRWRHRRPAWRADTPCPGCWGSRNKTQRSWGPDRAWWGGLAEMKDWDRLVVVVTIAMMRFTCILDLLISNASW